MAGFHLETLVDQAWAPTHPGGMAASVFFPFIGPSTVRPDTFQRPGTQQAGDGVIPFGEQQGNPGSECPLSLLLYPYGLGEPGATFQVAVYGWSPTKFPLSPLGLAPLWLPVLLPGGWLSVTLGPMTVGLDGADLANTVRFAPGVYSVPSLGHRLLEVQFQGGPGIAGMGCLYRKR